MGMFSYKIKAKCSNCATISEIKVPNGTPIQEYLDSGKGKCTYCKCNQFEGHFDKE